MVLAVLFHTLPSMAVDDLEVNGFVHSCVVYSSSEDRYT